MTLGLVLLVLAVYFSILITISWVTASSATTETFFTANRRSPWYLVVFGMIGASLSGVTFISVPGSVAHTGFSYFQVVLGYGVGYAVIAFLLMPLYYNMGLTSIYTYLGHRFGQGVQKTGSLLFLLSRTVGSSLRLFLTVNVLHTFIFGAWGVPFYLVVTLTIALIWLYTFRGGIRTIVWTDTFQTTFLLLAVLGSVWEITNQMGLSFGEMVRMVAESEHTRIFYFDDPNSNLFFPKHFLGGVFIAIAVAGLDQDMMQKHLTCKSLPEAKRSILWLSFVLLWVNALFLILGALLYSYCAQRQIPLPISSDDLFPQLALGPLGLFAGLSFLLGIIASAYASSDSALAALTTSFCVDFLSFSGKSESRKRVQKNLVHIGFSVAFLVIILAFKVINQGALIVAVLTIAGYTYGPLLGLFAFGLFTQYRVRQRWVPVVCLLAPILTYVLVRCAAIYWPVYQVGLEVLIFNGLITFGGLYLVSFSPQGADLAITLHPPPSVG